ncbi:MAG: glutamine-hydrolyzing carbamoyl-phosphate synthase small subunit [Spirochaetes bacterium]|nr:glutamine-hydrolyzing carbamoyl-phosphate synthase small subunit [Spirochaetota bacterium]
MNNQAYLVLEDGSVYQGQTLGKGDYTEGEVVFNTSMAGYQEVLTDPSYAGQIVVMTYPLIGNYGCIEKDNESVKIQVRGFVVKEACDFPNNYRSTGSLQNYFAENNILGISNIDTRSITRKIRQHGTLKGYITRHLQDETEKKEQLNQVEDIGKIDLVKQVTTEKSYVFNPDQKDGKKIGILDFGMKYNIARIFANMKNQVVILPAFSRAEEILDHDFDLLLLSNGPGDPKMVTYGIQTTQKLIGRLPICGICLGHQIISLALGLDTFKLKFGHRGGNHPVKNLLNNKVLITTQNHGYAVKNENIPQGIEITHLNLNDHTVEGLRCVEKKIASIQFHPEAAPGPRDCQNIFQDFIRLCN